MAESEINIIAHLLNVEQNAFVLTKDAQEKANHLISEAKARADSEFNEKFEKISSEIEADFLQKKEALTSSYQKEIDDYRSKIKEVPVNKKAFFDFLYSTVNNG